jgi:galactokinase
MSISEIFRSTYRQLPECIGSAPGRIEVLGNHTDYNKGIVLSAAVGYCSEFAVKKSNDGQCRIYDAKFDELVCFSMDNLVITEQGHWGNYFKGLVLEFISNGVQISGLEVCFVSSVPLGGGMSSSAALLISAAVAINQLFAANRFSEKELIFMAQKVENNFLGLNSGLLDQMTSMFGRVNKLLLCDFTTNRVESYIPFSDEYIFLAADSGVKHKLADSEYNSLRKSCEKAVSLLKKEYPSIESLRDVSKSMLNNCKDKIPFRIFKRAEHIVNELERVFMATDLLIEKKFSEFGELLYESHESSKYLFENSCSELDLLVELSQSIPNCYGARLSGGGFGGISIHLVKKNDAELYSDRLKTAFNSQTGRDLRIYECTIAGGASIS